MKYNLSLVALLLAPVSSFVRPVFLQSTRSTNGRFRTNDFKHDHAILSSTTAKQIMAFDTIDSTAALESAQALVSSQSYEAEIFADLAHVILDFATLFSPDTLLLRLLILMARAFNIMSDFIPDQHMTADEVVVQSCMFTLSTRNVVKMLLPWYQSIEQAPASFQDRRIFSSIFRPAGFSWQQYKFLLLNKSLEWIEIAAESHHCLSQQNLLLTHKGAVFMIDPAGKDSAAYGRRSGRCTNVFVGDLSLFKDLLDVKIGKKKMLGNTDSPLSEFQILQTANTRATVLRVNTSKLLDSAKDDSRIAEAAKNMIFNAIQDRLKIYDSGSNETNQTEALLSSQM
jgi:hypothetical protein